MERGNVLLGEGPKSGGEFFGSRREAGETLQEFRGDEGVVHVAELTLDKFEFTELGRVGVVEFEAVAEFFSGDAEGVELFDFCGGGGVGPGGEECCDQGFEFGGIGMGRVIEVGWLAGF